MNRKLVNIALIVCAVAIVFIIGKDFVGKKAGKNIKNPYEYNVDEFRKVDSTAILYRETVSFPVKETEPKGIAVSGKEIVVATEKFILKYDYSGKELFRKELPDTAQCVTVDSNNEIWVGTLNSVLVFDQGGTLLKRWNSFGDESVITSLAVSDENIYVADAGNRIVYHCNTNGQILAKFGAKDETKGVPGYIIPSPYFDLALDDSGFLWVANTGRHSLENYNPDGSMRTSWGHASFRTEGFAGCCNPAQFAILDDNSFITSEKGMPRIKLYDQHGAFKGVVASPDMFDAGSYLAPDVAIDADQRVVALDFERKQVRIFEKEQDGNE
jgi:ligand-binding sensor domain-containing protein